jgi:hypothetical protein
VKQDYWFLNKERYEPFLDDIAITEQEYLSAMHELAQLFPWEKSLATYQKILRRFRESGGINHFNLIPYPNERLLYNPIYVLLGAGILDQLLYLALALHDTKNAIGRTK